MDKPIYYKYRSLDNFEFFVDILLNQRLYATSYENMNDAMEGIYYHLGLPRAVLKNIKEGKEDLKICSLSRKRNEPLLWAHYANGSRGVNIGLEITGHNLDIRDIIYDNAPTISDCSDVGKTAKEILTHKHESWKYEEETRIFSTNSYVKVQIKEIILGQKVSNHHKTLVKGLVKKLIPDAQVIDYKSI